MQVLDRIFKELAGIDPSRLSEPVLVGVTLKPNQTAIGELPAELRPFMLLKLDYEARITLIEETAEAEIAAIDSREQADKRAKELANEHAVLATIYDAIGKLFWAEVRLTIPAATGQPCIGIAENWQVYSEDKELCPHCGIKHPSMLLDLADLPPGPSSPLEALDALLRP